MKFFACFCAVALLAGTAAAQLEEWPVGEEQELRPGYYTKILAESDGWVTFQIESKSGKKCFTAKPKVGGSLPLPLEDMFFPRKSAFIAIEGDLFDKTAQTWRIEGPHRGSAEFRQPGERFMTESKLPSSDFSLDGKVIEFIYEGWRYPNINEGYVKVDGQFDMTGMKAAAERHFEYCGPNPHNVDRD